MKTLLTICIIFLTSCSSKLSLPQVEEIPASNDIIVNHYWNSEDSLEVYIPYKFKIRNESNKKILFDEISIWNTVKDHDFKYFDENGSSLKFLNDKSDNYILPHADKVIVIFTKVLEKKENVPTKYWKNIAKEEMLHNKDKFPATDVKLDKIDIWKKRRERDTISFRFVSNDQNDLFIYYSLKTRKIKAYTAKEIAEKYLEKHR
jgi:hypothetical protein